MNDKILNITPKYPKATKTNFVINLLLKIINVANIICFIVDLYGLIAHGENKSESQWVLQIAAILFATFATWFVDHRMTWRGDSKLEVLKDGIEYSYYICTSNMPAKYKIKRIDTMSFKKNKIYITGEIAYTNPVRKAPPTITNKVNIDAQGLDITYIEQFIDGNIAMYQN